MFPNPPKLDELHAWSLVKLDILSTYLPKYTQILKNFGFSKRAYVDAFAGAGSALKKKTGHGVETSPLRALAVDPAFSELHFVEHNRRKAEHLAKSVAHDKRATVHRGDCNVVLKDILPKYRWEDRWRVFCFLDPYGMQLSWDIVQLCGSLKTAEVLINFPIEGINRNVLRNDQSKVHPNTIAAMNKIWGDESWREASRSPQSSLFSLMGEEDDWLKGSNQQLADAFRERLKKVAGFECVPKPAEMRNSRGAIVYYLFFAGPKKSGADITGHLLESAPRLFSEHYGS